MKIIISQRAELILKKAYVSHKIHNKTLNNIEFAKYMVEKDNAKKEKEEKISYKNELTPADHDFGSR